LLTTASTVKGILQSELGMRIFSQCWVSHSLSDAGKVACVEAAKEMLKIFRESEMNDFDSVATGDESWSQHTTASSKMFIRSAAHFLSRMRRAVAAKNYDHGVLYHKRRIVSNVRPRGSTFNQLYFIHNIFPDLK
jgi:hypothetical protein